MARICSICSHPKRDEIERAITSGGRSISKIAQDFGVNYDALYRHYKVGHIPVSIMTASENEESERGESLSDLARRTLRTMITIMDDALGEGDRKVALMAADRVEKYIRLLQDMGAEEGGKISDTEEWSQFVSVIGELQDTHPEIGAMITARLEAVSS